MHFRKSGSLLALVLILAVATIGSAAAEKVPGAAQGGRSFSTTLLGINEVAPGDLDATGSATISLNYGQAQVCWEITTAGTSEVVGAHIHNAVAGVNGPIVVPLTATTDGTASGCAEADKALMKAIMQHPENYYVNVHSTEFPGGAVRGQLG